MTTIDTGTPDLLAAEQNGVLTLTLNRPDARNALTAAMLTALADQLARAEIDDAVRCVVLTGTGRAFCAGGDVKGMVDTGQPGAGGLTTDGYIHRQRLVQRATAGRLFAMPKPTIAAINGATAGAGLSLALACDFRVMADSAFLLTAFADVGLSGDFGGSWFATQLVGAAMARELYLLSERVDAATAERLGLASLVCPPDVLAAETERLAARLATGPAVAYRYMKENLNRALGGELGDCMDLEATHHVHCMATDDHRDAARAFVEKRRPVFAGR